VVAPLEDYRTVMLQRGIFQSVASMGLPAFTIHSVVRYSGRAMKDVKNVRVRTWGPIGLGLAVVPFLPTLFDKPVENAVEWAFHKGFETFGGHEAVGNAPLIGRERQLSERPKEKKE
jgi:fission process protein 1